MADDARRTEDHSAERDRLVAAIRKAGKAGGRPRHRQRHAELHAALDELIAGYLTQHRDKLLSNTTLLELIEWSHRQTINPTEGPST